MAPTQVARPFHHPGWVYEEKVDGWQVLAYKDSDGVRLVSRQGRDLTRRFPELVAAVGALEVPSLLLDGEIAVFDRQLLSRFEWLRGRPTDEAATPPTLIAFDCLYAGRICGSGPSGCGGTCSRSWWTSSGWSCPPAGLAPDGFEGWAQVIERGYEGMVGKDEASPYTEDRTLAWLKVKMPHCREGRARAGAEEVI